MYQISALVSDLGENSINAVAQACGHCWRFVKKCHLIFIGNGNDDTKIETRGRKSLTFLYPTIKDDITNIIEDYLSIDHRFKDEKQYVKLTVKEIKQQLIETGKYKDKDFCNSSLNNLLNKMEYCLKKVKKTKPLKKIKETDEIFDNVHKQKERTMNDDHTALISLDTKDKVLLGPFSRDGKK